METRVLKPVGVGMGVAATAAAYRRFLRPSFFRWGALGHEITRSYTGDDQVTGANYQSTLAVTIDAAPRDIWPWLLQLGNGRGGLYSYDFLDRLFGFLDQKSADHVLPEFQHLEPGDRIPVGHDPAAYFPVVKVDHERALVLAGQAPNGFSWSWIMTRKMLLNLKQRVECAQTLALLQAALTP